MEEGLSWIEIAARGSVVVIFKLEVIELELRGDADNERKGWMWETVQKESIKIFIT